MMLQIILCLCATISTIYGQCGINNEFDLRLVETPSIRNAANNVGRLEVCLDGVWGTIAADSFTTPWSEKNAQVACRQMGFSGALNPIFQNTVTVSDRANSSTPVHYSRVLCNGTENGLEDCIGTVETSSFNHLNDVLLVCRPTRSTSTLAYSDLHSAGPNPGDIRLLGSPTNGAGAVEIYTSVFGWTGICPGTIFSSSDAGAVCRALGYAGGSAQTFQITNDAIGNRYATDAVCTDSKTIMPPYEQAGVCSLLLSPSGCATQPTAFAGVNCFTDTVSEGTYRLFPLDPSDPNRPEGVVEVFFAGRWGVACDREFSVTESTALCNQLGYEGVRSSGISALSTQEAFFLESADKPLWVDGINCRRTTLLNDLSVCDKAPVVGFSDCRSFDIAAVRCGPSSSGGLSSGAVTGIVFATIVIVFFVAPVVWVFGKGYWKKRNSYKWYRCLTTPSDWCDCDCDFDCFSRSTPRRNWQPPQRPVAEVTITSTATTSTERFTQRRNSSSSSSSDSEPEREPEPEDPTLTKAPPPSYRAASNFPEHTPKADDLPPPYPGGPAPLKFAYPPQTAPAPYPSGATAPYPPTTAAPYPPGPPAPYPPSGGDGATPYPAGEQQYPPPTNPCYPPPQPSSDPAYPPEQPAGVGLPYPPDVPPPAGSDPGPAYPPTAPPPQVQDTPPE